MRLWSRSAKKLLEGSDYVCRINGNWDWPFIPQTGDEMECRQSTVQLVYRSHKMSKDTNMRELIIWRKLVYLTCNKNIGIFADYQFRPLFGCSCQNIPFIYSCSSCRAYAGDVWVVCSELTANWAELSNLKELSGARHIGVLLALRRIDV